jgi:transmembrane sensor
MHEMEFRLIERYLEGKASVDEKKQVLDFFKYNDLGPENEIIIREWWNNYKNENGIQGHPEKILRNIHGQIKTHGNKKSAYLRWFGIAASFFLLVSVTFFFYRHSDRVNNEQSAVEMVTKQTPKGAKLKFELPDGSMVNLNSNSKLTYPTRYEDILKVDLEGEAYFDVAMNTERAFVVECHSLTTTVIGTSFNISAFDEQNVVVSVTSGKVKVDIDEDMSQSIFLIPGEQVKWDKFSGAAQVQHFNLYKTLAWKEGVIIFDENGLCEIIDVLERWYGVEVQVIGVDDVCGVKWKYSGEFINENLRNVLNGIAYVKGFDYEINGKKILIKL